MQLRPGLWSVPSQRIVQLITPRPAAQPGEQQADSTLPVCVLLLPVRSKAEAIAEALSMGGFQFAFLHVKAVDDTGHDFLTHMKVGGRPALYCIEPPS